MICDGCNVRTPWEHRCCGDPCECVGCREADRLFSIARAPEAVIEQPEHPDGLRKKDGDGMTTHGALLKALRDVQDVYGKIDVTVAAEVAREHFRAHMTALTDVWQTEREQLRANLSLQVDGPYSVQGQMKTEIERLTAERDALAAFKAFVHWRLNTAGIATHPDGPHSKEGCRVGDRLDLLVRERDQLRARNAELKAECPNCENVAIAVNQRDEAWQTLAQIRAVLRITHESMDTLKVLASEQNRADVTRECLYAALEREAGHKRDRQALEELRADVQRIADESKDASFVYAKGGTLESSQFAKAVARRLTALLDASSSGAGGAANAANAEVGS